MSQPDSLEAFRSWAEEQGIRIEGVGPKRFPGRGVGIAATRDIKPGNEIIHIPFDALLHPENSIPRNFRKRFDSSASRKGTIKKAARSRLGKTNYHSLITTHGLIAAFLTYGDASTPRYSAWKATWPTYEDFRTTMPFLWPASLTKPWCRRCRKTADENCGHDHYCIELLPPEISSSGTTNSQDNNEAATPSGKFHTMRHKLLKDWQAIVKAGLARFYHDVNPSTLNKLNKLDHIIDPSFVYAWCIVNTRSFYFLHSTAPPPPPSKSDDAMLLCPFIDLFNHTSSPASENCNVSFDDASFTVTANRSYSVGEELLVSYGTHSNGFLMAEYGFLLGQNGHDMVSLDVVILPDLSPTQRQTLEGCGYLGGYTLQFPEQDERSDPDVCWRTQVAAHLFVLNDAEWKEFAEGRFVDPVTVGWERRALGRKRKTMRDVPDAYRKKTVGERANEKVCGWLKHYSDEAKERLDVLKEMGKNLEEVVRVFGGEGEGDGDGEEQMEGEGRRRGKIEERARERYKMVDQRWTEIWSMCLGAVRRIEKEENKRRKLFE